MNETPENLGSLKPEQSSECAVYASRHTARALQVLGKSFTGNGKVMKVLWGERDK